MTLSRIVLGIAGLPDGHGVALEILHMHFHGRRDEQAVWDPSLIDCGRRLLQSYPLDQPQARRDYALAELATVCLSGNEAAADAERLCRRILDTNGGSVWWEFGELIKALLTLHPQVALGCWLGATQDEEWRQVRFFDHRESRHPLRVVPLPILLEWARQDSDTRFPRLARTIPAFEKKDGTKAWSEAALALLSAGPDRAAELRGLTTQLYPSGWSGSLADILEQRRPLLQPFLADDDPAIREIAQASDDALRQTIKAERTNEASRDEQFE